MSEANNNFPVEAQAQKSDDNTHPALRGLMKLSPGRQIGMMLALAVSVAIGLAVVLWAQEPSYDLLLSGIAEKSDFRIFSEGEGT